MSQFGSQVLSPLPGFGLPGVRHSWLPQSVVCLRREKLGFLMELKVQHFLGQTLKAASQQHPNTTLLRCHGHCSHHMPGTMSQLWNMVFGKSRWNCTLIFSSKNKSISWQHSLLDTLLYLFSYWDKKIKLQHQHVNTGDETTVGQHHSKKRKWNFKITTYLFFF